MSRRLTNLEWTGILLAFLLGAVLRFTQLGALPLSDTEAALALQATSIASGQSALVGSQPGYVLFTSALFFLFRDTNLLARFWPAVFGSLIILSPLLFRRQLGALPTVLLGFALAIDPGLTAIARQAGGTTLAVSGLVFSAGFLLNQAFIPAGIFLGLSLLGGPAVWFGLFAALLAFGFTWLLSSQEQRQEWRMRFSRRAEIPWRMFLVWAAGVFLIAGSLFFLVPGGISAAAGSFVEFLRAWWTPAGTARIETVMAILAYAPLALLFGGIQGIRGLIRQNPLDRWLILFWVVGFVSMLLMAGRSYIYLAWTMIPLWVLAVRGLAKLRVTDRIERIWVAGVALLYGMLLVFAWLSVLGLSHTVNPEDAQIRVLSFAGALLLLVLTGVLLAWGWSVRVALLGAGWGITAVLTIVVVRAVVAAAGLGASPENQLWRLDAPILQADLLEKTVEDLSDWHTGERTSLDITVAGIDSPALQWLLKDFRQVRIESVLSSQVSPGMVVTVGEETPILSTQYRGQDFLWTHQPVWRDFTLDTWWNWLAFQRAPAESKTLILWARADVFPGGSLPAGE